MLLACVFHSSPSFVVDCEPHRRHGFARIASDSDFAAGSDGDNRVVSRLRWSEGGVRS
jgi:hypothetical protein